MHGIRVSRCILLMEEKTWNVHNRCRHISVASARLRSEKGNSKDEAGRAISLSASSHNCLLFQPRSVPVLRRSEVHAHYYAAQNAETGPSPEPRVNERPGRGSEDYKTSLRKHRAPEIRSAYIESGTEPRFGKRYLDYLRNGRAGTDL